MLNFLPLTARETQETTQIQEASGYTRLILAPGGEIKIGVIRAYADIEVPVF